ncbi:MAG: GtrA family protein [Bacteroidota bacterium]
MKTFAKAQLSSLLGGAIDYLTMIFFTEIVGLFYTNSIIIGGTVGAIFNYSMNRKWTFEARSTRKRTQLPRFFLIVAGSIFLKTLGTYCLTNYGKMDYKISRIVVDLFVAIGFNFPMQKYWVFNDKNKEVL